MKVTKHFIIHDDGRVQIKESGEFLTPLEIMTLLKDEYVEEIQNAIGGA